MLNPNLTSCICWKTKPRCTTWIPTYELPKSLVMQSGIIDTRSKISQQKQPNITVRLRMYQLPSTHNQNFVNSSTSDFQITTILDMQVHLNALPNTGCRQTPLVHRIVSKWFRKSVSSGSGNWNDSKCGKNPLELNSPGHHPYGQEAPRTEFCHTDIVMIPKTRVNLKTLKGIRNRIKTLTSHFLTRRRMGKGVKRIPTLR